MPDRNQPSPMVARIAGAMTEPITQELIEAGRNLLMEKMQELETKVDQKVAEFQTIAKEMHDDVQSISQQMENLTHNVGDLSKNVGQIKDLIEALQFVKTSGKLIKWVAGIVAAVFAAWAAITGGKFGG